MAAAMVGSWTFCHGRDQPYPRQAPGETALNGYSSMELAPLNAHMPSDAEIWTGMLGLPLPVRERFAKQLDIPQPGLLSRVNQLAALVAGIRDTIVAVGLSEAMEEPEQQAALLPLATLGRRLRPLITLMVTADGLPINSSAGDRDCRLAQRAIDLFSSSMSQAANASGPPRSFLLADALNYNGRSRQEALSSLVGPESLKVPGRFAVPPPPVALPDLLFLGLQRCDSEIEDMSPLESLLDLRGEVEGLGATCSATVQAYQETRETVTGLRSDLIARVSALEARVGVQQTLATLEDLQDYREVLQGHVDQLNETVRAMVHRVAHIEITQPHRAAP
jgi:uncharacterized coiled-coil protein SlyX